MELGPIRTLRSVTMVGGTGSRIPVFKLNAALLLSVQLSDSGNPVVKIPLR